MSQNLPESAETSNAPFPWQAAQWSQLSRAFAAKQLAHAYLFSGSEGLGKSLFAEALARFALCTSPRTQKFAAGVSEAVVACGQCSSCLKGGVGNHPDIFRIELEDGSKNIKIEQIRRLSEFVIRTSHAGGAKVAIIQDAHLLNANAANALLKTLEEPSDDTHLLLVSDYPGRLAATIRSRCQKLAFQVPGPELATIWLRSIIGEGNLAAIVEASDCRPLIALQLAAGDSLQTRAQLLQNLCDVKAGKKSIQQVLALSAKTGELEVLQHFSTFLSKLTKYSLTGIEKKEGDPALQAMYQLLDPSEEKSIAQAVASSLSHFYMEVETARRQLASSTNPNPQLIMESILWRWSKLRLR